MIKTYIYRISQILLMACLLTITTGCRETIMSIFSDDIEEGEEVMFTISLPSAAALTRAEAPYTAPKEDYQFTIGMYIEGKNDPIATGVYHPVSTVTKDENGNVLSIEYDAIGTLAYENNKALYWPSTTTAYGFKATAGTTDLEADQTTKEKWLLQDRLEGETDGYKTARKWKEDNALEGMTANDDDYKKIPIKLQHKRSLITVILKAGEGVSRQALYYSAAAKDIVTRIYSHTSDTMGIKPWAKGVLLEYDDGTRDSTTCYEAIVMPFDYFTDKDNNLMAKINLSGQNYSFYAGYDKACSSDNYNLTAGKHLTIMVTLTRDIRKVMMSAYIEDWTEEVTTTVCDDHGNAGEPIEINNRDELIDFLTSDTKNKAGNVALVTKSIDLADWTPKYDLNCTLNLGGCTIISNHRFLDNLASTASLVNGTVQIGAEVDAAIAETNNGVIEDVKIAAKDGTTAHATTAGAVTDNLGTISKCHSSLSVYGGTKEHVGGIAATSTSTDNKAAIIDACTVTGSVSGGTYGGGIVGKANGYVTNNTFEYGITLLQPKDKYKNIVAVENTAHKSYFDKNAWPTVDDDFSMVNATPADECYTGIIANQTELQASVTDAKINTDGNSFRLAQNITLNFKDDVSVRNVYYELDGNNMQITTDSMIFESITGKIHDLTIYLNSDLIAVPNYKFGADAIAPLARSVHGDKAEISNVKVKMADGTRIQAANPAGLVVWAYGGAKISNCEVKANIQTWLDKKVTPQGERFAGGIVSQAARATISQCVFHSIKDNNTLSQNRNSNYVNSGTANDINQSTIIYYGGIVGGVNHMEEENPNLTITDCTCYVTLPKDNYHGGILGYAYYGNDSNTLSACQGNWWPGGCYGVGTPNADVVSLIGKRNSNPPTETAF